MSGHYSLNTEIGADNELFKAIITLDKKRIKELKASGFSSRSFSTSPCRPSTKSEW